MTDLWVVVGLHPGGPDERMIDQPAQEFELGWHRTEPEASKQLAQLELDFQNDGWAYWLVPPATEECH